MGQVVPRVLRLAMLVAASTSEHETGSDGRLYLLCNTGFCPVLLVGLQVLHPLFQILNLVIHSVTQMYFYSDQNKYTRLTAGNRPP